MLVAVCCGRPAAISVADHELDREDGYDGELLTELLYARLCSKCHRGSGKGSTSGQEASPRSPSHCRGRPSTDAAAKGAFHEETAPHRPLDGPRLPHTASATDHVFSASTHPT